MEKATVARSSGAKWSKRSSAGAYAVEYALIFPVFFILLYGIFAYGFIFAMRMGLQHAAEEGAREALRYQVPSSPGDTQVGLREATAETVARIRANWIENLGALNVRADICPQVDLNCLPTVTSSELPDNLVCGDTLTGACQIVVTVEYPYQSYPVFPSIPGLGLILPTRLQGRARALLDGRSMSPL